MEHEQLQKYLIDRSAVVVEAMERIDANARGILFVTNEPDQLTGVVTDGDVRRWLIRTGNLQGRVSDIMNLTPKFILSREIGSARKFMKKYSITAVPVVTEEHVILDIIFRENERSDGSEDASILSDVPVVIMAGGKGTRLYPYTKILPKPLIPIGDIPIMERIIHEFMDCGAERFYATINYKKEMIKSYFSDTPLHDRLKYVEEEQPLGTAGSLRLIKEQFDRPFILTNCDILIREDYTKIYKHHIETDNEMTIVTALKNVTIPYGVIYSGENGRIDAMEEKPMMSYFVNTGMYILNEELIGEIPVDAVFHMTDLTDKLLKEGRRVGMYPISEDSFLDMGELEEMRRMEQKLNLNSD